MRVRAVLPVGQDSVDPDLPVAVVVERRTILVHPLLDRGVSSGPRLDVRQTSNRGRSVLDEVTDTIDDRGDLLSDLLGEEADQSVLVLQRVPDLVKGAVDLTDRVAGPLRNVVVPDFSAVSGDCTVGTDSYRRERWDSDATAVDVEKTDKGGLSDGTEVRTRPVVVLESLAVAVPEESAVVLDQFDVIGVCAVWQSDDVSSRTG